MGRGERTANLRPSRVSPMRSLPESLSRLLIELIQQPFQLGACASEYGAVGKKPRFLTGIFVLKLRVHFAADDHDFQRHSEAPRDDIGVFLSLGLGVATDGERERYRQRSSGCAERVESYSRALRLSLTGTTKPKPGPDQSCGMRKFMHPAVSSVASLSGAVKTGRKIGSCDWK